MTYYDYIAEGYDELHREEQIKKIKLILNKFDISKKKVLDIGCGMAFYANLFDDYTGVDNSEELLKRTKAQVILADAEDLPFENKSFDAVISLTAIHNFDDFRKAIDEMNRVSNELIIISLFKRSKDFEEIKKYFNADEEINEEKDIILVKKLT